MPPSAGMRFGRYELLSRLGVGGMGEVFRARDHDLQRDVAVKFLPERFASDPVRLGRFAQEARAASSLNHPNIVTIHEIGETSGLPYIVMELVEGRTLRELVEGPPLPARRILRVAAQLADGLAKAHGAGIVHRDLKPENVMVTPDGYVKILDFGLAKLRASDPDTDGRPFDSNVPTWPGSPGSPVTAAGTVFGTVGYMSPEQARGRVVDFRSDQFAFGAIVYEMASSRQAFRRETPAQTLTAIIENEPESLEGLNPTFPAPARWIVERCLEKEPSDRYASTLDLARELHTVHDRLAEASSGASEPGPRAASRGVPPRRRTAWSVAVLVGLLVVLAGPLRDCLQPPLPPHKQVAVLPFANAGGEPETQAFCDGLVETLSTKLTQLERFQTTLRVVPFSEVRSAGIQSVGAARESFGVTLVVTGSVQRIGEAIRLTANLVDAESLRQLRAVVLDAERGDPVALQDGLIRQVADMLDLEISSEAGVVLAAGGTGVGSAWERYVEGRGHLQRYDDPVSVDAAISAFQAALQRDPEYALAYAGLGEAYWREYELTRDDQAVALAQRSCERALALNDLLAPVHVTLGLLHTGTGELDAARLDFEKALALDPLNADAIQGKARVLELSGDPDQAERTYLRALELRPDYWGFHNALAVFYWRQARYADAEREFRRVIELTPGNIRGYTNLGGLLFLMGREDEAVAVLERSLAIRPTHVALSNLGTIQFFRGRYEEAAEAFRKALEQNDRDLDLWRNLGAALYWTPGRRGEARPAFERARELAEAALRVNPRDTSVLTALADAHAMLGEGRAARERLGEALALAPEDVNVQFRAAQICAALGDRSAALKWLIKALEGGYSLRELLSVPDLAELRQDPRFQKALKARMDSDVIPE